MTLARTGDLVARAADSGSAVFAFNVISLEHAEGIVLGAERTGSSVLLQVSENAVLFHGAHAPLLAACREVAAAASVSVGIHLDHVQAESLTLEIVDGAAASGVSSIMIDASQLEFEENLRVTASRAAVAHEVGLWVEAELGEVGGKDGAHAPGVRTDPEEARDFVLATGVDALAVAVGSSHAMTTPDAALDLDVIRLLASRVPVPLVLHGSSGVPPATISAAVLAGIRKVNFGTGLNIAFTGAVRSHLQTDAAVSDPRKYLSVARDAVADAVAELCGVVRRVGD